MICSFEKLLQILSGNSGYTHEPPVPNCPKNADAICANLAGHCETGNSHQCEQKFRFFINGIMFQLAIQYAYKKNSRTGFFESNDIAIKRLILKNILTINVLKSLSIE